MQRWLDYEFEALRWNVDSDVSRQELAALVEDSTVDLCRDEHSKIHAGDFARWGRRGGLATLRHYGTAWFSLLARRRWEKIVATPGALSLLAATATNPAQLLDRHVAGDWGEVPPEDARENERSLKYGFRIVSSYSVGGPGERVWIITEADRSSTCLLLPTEY